MTACPKPKPSLLEKRAKAADLARVDKAESAKVRTRSGGRCEVIEESHGVGRETGAHYWSRMRCSRYAAPGNHHLRGGSGVRNRGASILSEHRIDVCQRCHDEITGNVLQPLGTPAQRESAATVIYSRRTT